MKKGLILLVEDEDSILYNLELLLSINNYSVLSFSNAVDALQYLMNTENYPDLIVSDVLMPEMDGFEFIKRMKGINSRTSIPFIFISALCYEKDIYKGKKLGAIAYIQNQFMKKSYYKK